MPGSRSRRRTPATRLAILAVAVMVSGLLASVPASAAATGSIAGVVTGPGGLPLEGAQVHLFESGSPRTGVVTDATGAYVFPNLQAGDYHLLYFDDAPSNPLASEWYDDAVDQASADSVHVSDGAAVTGINFELALGARVTGRLTTPTGVGVDNGVVSPERLDDGTSPAFSHLVSTDANGFYVIQALPAGTYVLRFDDLTRDVTEYWNDKASFDAADRIVMAAGQERTGFDAILSTPGPPPPLPAIVNTQPPQISGATAPQVGYPMSLSTGSWTPSNVGVSGQWLAGGQPIPGAFHGEYKPTVADLGKTLTVNVTASLPGYVSTTVTTLPTLPVSKQVQNNLRPWLKGKAQVGERLKVKTGVWRPLFVVTFKYRWYADGQRIRGARSDRLQLTSALKGTKIFCRVTGSAPGLDLLKVRTRSSAKVTR